MRSHAKAPSAGSNSGRGSGLGPFLAALVLCLCATACLLPGSALAGQTRLPLESFGSDGTESSSFELGDALDFDQGNKHLYVLEQGAARIAGFDTSTAGTHTPLGGNFPLTAPDSEFGWVDDIAVNSASHNLYYLSEKRGFFGETALFGFDVGGSALGGNFPLAGFGDPCGTDVDPSGNIWVGDYAAEAVKQYSSSGNLIRSVSTAAEGHPCFLAFDSEANLYVSMYGGTTWKYFKNTGPNGYSAKIKVDPAAAGFTPPAAPIAVDRSTGQLYVVHAESVSVYGPSGGPLYEFGDTIASPVFAGIAIDEASDEVYVSDPLNAIVRVFGPPIPLPTVFTEDADAVSDIGASLHATVNPEGKALTDCHFDYVPASQFEVDQYQSVTPAQQAPCVPAAGSIPADSTNHAVKADVSGLSPATTYHFRLVAATAEGSANGADRTFAAAIGAPTVSAQAAETIGTSDVTVSAKINPKGAKTTYHVEYGTTAAYGQSTPESAPIGFASDGSDHSVSVHIGGLDPATVYHFRFVATSLAGKAEGTDADFATYAPVPGSPSCSNESFRTGFGSRLSDCRAYEQVTPADKNGANAQGAVTNVQASSSGDRVTFYLNGGLPTTGGSSEFAAFMASRGPSGWSSDGLLPLLNPGQSAHVIGWSEDLATTLAGGDVRGLDRTALYLRDSDSSTFPIGFMGPEGLSRNTFFEARLRGYAADTAHLIFEGEAALLPGAAGGGQSNLYDLDHGTLTLPGRIPVFPATSCDEAGGPACVAAPEGVFASNDFASLAHNVSRDGSKVFFTDRASGRLYVREDGTRTTQVSASQKTNGDGPGGSDPLGPRPAKFRAATPGGEHALFTSSEELTDDANTGFGPTIARANLDGSGIKHGFIGVPEAASGVAVDGDHVYWANPVAGTIGRANLDGSGADQSFIAGASNPTGVAVDGSHVYWTNAADGTDGAGTIGRANLDGTSPNQSFIAGADNPQAVAVDGAFVYWANAGATEATRSIGRANLDGTGSEQSFIALGGPGGPTGVAVDASRIYWTNPGTGTNFFGTIESATLAGAGRTDIARNLSNPGGLALDDSYVYWSDNVAQGFGGTFGKMLGRAKLDGSDKDKTFLDFAFIATNGARGLASDGAHLYWGAADGRDTGNDLYSYDSASGELTDLSADSDPGDLKGADVQGLVGTSTDGSYVYFVANGVLAPGAQHGNCINVQGSNGTCNLYLAHAGSITFVARLSGTPSTDEPNWNSSRPTSRVAADGSALVFSSRRLVDLSGRDHNCAGGGCAQFYRYTPADEETVCLTCTTTGTPPRQEGLGLGSDVGFGLTSGVTAVLPRNLSADGDHFFFESADALLPTDTNGVVDVYEWEAKGSGSCKSESQNGGCLYLISSGTSPDPSHFLDASADGDHAFFFTDQQLVPGDRDQLEDVYDAGVGGGLASQHALAPPTCSSAACQANPAPPPDPPTSSATFSGPGNAKKPPAARKCPKGKRKVRRAGKVRCQKASKAKQHKRHSNRGGSK